MRRALVLLVFSLVLASPAAAATLRPQPGDGTLVVRGADNGDGVAGRAVVTLVIRGSVIGEVSGAGRIAISELDPADSSTPEVTGAAWHRDVSATGTKWGGTDIRFRAIGGTFRVVIWGSGVDLFAIGRGTATMTGQVDSPLGDGTYSLNGGEFRSLPSEATGITVGAAPTE